MKAAGTGSLSRKQKRALDALKSTALPLDGSALAHILETSPEGAHQTMASLVRRGLARKGKVRGAVRYEAMST